MMNAKLITPSVFKPIIVVIKTTIHETTTTTGKYVYLSSNILKSVRKFCDYDTDFVKWWNYNFREYNSLTVVNVVYV